MLNRRNFLKSFLGAGFVLGLDNPMPRFSDIISDYGAGEKINSPINNRCIPFMEPYNVLPKWTFENFMVGPSNQSAYAAAKKVAESPGKAYNPFYIYGNEGLGRTHLAGSICNHITDRRRDFKVLYVSGEQFVNDVLIAIRYCKMPELEKKYRSVDLLFTDDMQFLENKSASQEKLLYIIKSLYKNQKQIVVTCDKHPKKLTNRLGSLFNTGLITEIQPPEFETRIAVIHKKASVEGIDLPGNVVNLIASEIKTNIREIEGCLIRLQAQASLTGRRIDMDMIRNILKDFA